MNRGAPHSRESLSLTNPEQNLQKICWWQNWVNQTLRTLQPSLTGVVRPVRNPANDKRHVMGPLVRPAQDSCRLQPELP